MDGDGGGEGGVAAGGDGDRRVISDLVGAIFDEPVEEDDRAVTDEADGNGERREVESVPESLSGVWGEGDLEV
jgi:hypothetical protein